jgi:hypothetical protein
MSKTNALITLALVATLAAVGGVCLYAQKPPAASPPRTPGAVSTLFAERASSPEVSSSEALETEPNATSETAIHTIGQVTLSPSLIGAGTSQPITLTATITDPDVIASSVDVVYSRPGIPGATILGTLHDDGLNGDAIAGDDVYTLVFTLPSLSAGEVDLQVTAAFKGVITRTKSPLVPVYINPAASTAGWTPFSDSLNLFTVSLPPTWNVHLIQTYEPNSLVTESVQFVLTDGTLLFTIDVFAPAQWQALANGITPLLVGQSSRYFFGLAQAQDFEDTNALTANQILSQLPTIYSTFVVH